LRRAGIYLIPFLASVSAAASDLPPGGGFSLPLNCTPGTDCWVINYPDMTLGPDMADPACGPRSYDGHKSTDLAIRDLATMRRGVPVLAVADGVVRRTRDGMPDKIMRTKEEGAQMKWRGCGNGMVVDHGNGWQTQYCHLRRGSVALRPGDSVRRGQKLGLVGMSGRTQFPHVHLTIRLRGQELDPMTGRSLTAGCGRGGWSSLWREDSRQTYRPVSLYAVGFATGPVTARTIKEDAARPVRIDRSAPALVLWAAVFGVRAGDELVFSITGPDGKTLLRRGLTVARTQAWRFQFAGLRRKQALWPLGHYRGQAVLRRSMGKTSIASERRTEFLIK
jgi:hypothetical protein